MGSKRLNGPTEILQAVRSRAPKRRGRDQARGGEGCVCGGEQTALLTLKMKKSSMNMAPKGRIPAMRMLQQNRRVNTGRSPGSLPSQPD